MKLYYQEFLIGILDGVFESEGTWWATFSQSAAAESIPELERALSFIRFCKEWNLRHSSDSPPDAGEFDQFADVCQHGFWAVVEDGMPKRLVEQFPNFLNEGDISWKKIATQPRGKKAVNTTDKHRELIQQLSQIDAPAKHRR